MPGSTDSDASSLHGQITTWFRYWHDREPPREEDAVIICLMREFGALADQLHCSELYQWVRGWNKRLFASFSLELPRESVLCAFSCVEDTIYRLDQEELNQLIGWITAKVPDVLATAADRAASGANAAAGDVRQECHDWADVLAALLCAWQAKGERPLVRDAKLRVQMADYVAGRERACPDRVVRLQGGAAANMSNALGKLDMSVAVHWPYHAEDVARLCPRGVERLTIAAGQPMLENAAQSGSPDHPLRRSIILSYGPGIQLSSSPDTLEQPGPSHQDRQIYRFPHYSLPDDRGWSEMFLADGNGREVQIHDPGNAILNGAGWPFLPLFGNWEIRQELGRPPAFVFHPADESAIRNVGRRFDYVILSGIHAINDPIMKARDENETPVNEAVRTLIQQTLKRQLAVLAEEGARLHLECSGFNSPAIVDWASEIMRKSVRSAGINDEELESITGGESFDGTPYFFRSRRPSEGQTQEGMRRRYDRALHLAGQLGLDRLYVHATDADLILVRGANRGALQQHLMGSLFSKGVVVLALLERSVPEWEKIAAEMQLVLRLEGFVALLQLAEAIAKRQCPQPGAARDRLVRDILFSGYWFNRDPEAYSVVVVPVMWPDPPHDLSPTGAGDICSACFAVLGRS